MANILGKAGSILGSPMMGIGMAGLGAAKQTMQGNKMAKASQDPLSLMQGSQGQVGYLSDPRHLQGAGQAMTAPGQSQMGAEIVGNSLANSGATLTSQQTGALDPQARQRMQQQGAATPGFLQNFMGQMSPQFLYSIMQGFTQKPQEEEATPQGGQ